MSSSHSLYCCLGFVPSLVLFSFLLSCVSFYLIATLSSRATRRKSCYVISSGSTFHILRIIRLQNTSKDGWLKQFTVYSIWWTSILVFLNYPDLFSKFKAGKNACSVGIRLKENISVEMFLTHRMLRILILNVNWQVVDYKFLLYNLVTLY